MTAGKDTTRALWMQCWHDCRAKLTGKLKKKCLKEALEMSLLLKTRYRRRADFPANRWATQTRMTSCQLIKPPAWRPPIQVKRHDCWHAWSQTTPSLKQRELQALKSSLTTKEHHTTSGVPRLAWKSFMTVDMSDSCTRSAGGGALTFYPPSVSIICPSCEAQSSGVQKDCLVFLPLF